MTDAHADGSDLLCCVDCYARSLLQCELPLNDQRALTKHLLVHARAFDEEEVRTAKSTPVKPAKHTPNAKGKRTQSPLGDGGSAAKAKRRSGGLGASGAAAADGTPRPKKPQVIRRGGVSDASQSDSDAEGAAAFIARAAASSSAPPKKRKGKNAVASEPEDLSEEERRQSKLRHEQKRLNMARLAAGEEANLEEKHDEPGEEDVRCCLCHSADSDETNPIVMCDGPCGQ